MKYQINVPEMHCSGCDALMKITLEDYFQNIKPNHDTKIVEFESMIDLETVGIVLKKLFEEFEKSNVKYTFSNLIVLN